MPEQSSTRSGWSLVRRLSPFLFLPPAHYRQNYPNQPSFQKTSPSLNKLITKRSKYSSTCLKDYFRATCHLKVLNPYHLLRERSHFLRYHFWMILFLSTGPHSVPVHNERRVREMARVDRPGAVGRCRVLGARWGTSGDWRRGVARPDREVQPTIAGFRGQTACVPRARRAFSRACAEVPPAAAGAARCAPRAPPPLAPHAYQTSFTRSSDLIGRTDPSPSVTFVFVLTSTNISL